MNLTEFLLARIAEDEAVANAVDPFAPQFEDDYEGSTARELLWDSQPHGRKCGWKLGEGIANDCTCNYPARVLAECEAKRHIVEYAAGCEEIATLKGGAFAEGMRCASLHHLRRLAMPYADHPDYRQEWKP